MSSNFNKSTLLILSLIVIGVFYFWPVKKSLPEESEFLRSISPNGEWIAKVMSSITSAPMVTSATYYVSVSKNSINEKSTTIYATDLSGPADIFLKWKKNDILIIEDTRKTKTGVYKNTNSPIQVEFKE